MAASSPDRGAGRKRLRAVAAVLLIAGGFAGSALAAGPTRSDAPILVDAASSDFDYKNNTLRFKQIRVTQGPVRVEADEANATGLNFENSDWVFRGHVQITVEGGHLNSDEANVSFKSNLIERAVITGTPAEFEQKLPSSGDLAHGRAGTIEYDFGGATVRLRQDAFLTDGRNDISGQTLIYSIREQRVMANPGEQDAERVRITINPRTAEQQPQQPATQAAEPPQ